MLNIDIPVFIVLFCDGDWLLQGPGAFTLCRTQLYLELSSLNCFVAGFCHSNRQRNENRWLWLLLSQNGALRL